MGNRVIRRTYNAGHVAVHHCFSPLTGKWVIRHALLCDGRNGITAGFQSPYGEMGNTTLKFSYRDLMLNRSFSPLTGKWVIRLL